ncbi:hypothetical protein LPJ53_001171 [Coemansia erecta]|uniref:Chitin-binding type-2 domain-containing protein n=1 Tax=Coemansia erecta TaxID=147472 RepID=A0A9W7Y410_9FUNG|nr:hypothetical protein LPJ53_001171 [Coemansia erecta]
MHFTSTNTATYLTIALAASAKLAAAQSSTQDYVLCPTEGAIQCVDDFNFMVCDHGYWRASQSCAQGSFCLNDVCVNSDSVPSSLVYGDGSVAVSGIDTTTCTDTTASGTDAAGTATDDAGTATDGAGTATDGAGTGTDVQYVTITTTSCDDDYSDTGSGTGSDVISDGGSDTISDGGSDTMSDGGSDIISDDGSDVISDDGSDVISDDGSDILSDDVSDILSDDVSDTETDTGLDTGSETPDDYQQLNDSEDSTNGAASIRNMGFFGSGAIASLASAVVVSALFSFA